MCSIPALVLLAGPAFGAEALLLAPEGDPMPGTETALVLAVWDGTTGPVVSEVPQVMATAGEVVSVTATEPDGIWRVLWRTPEEGESADLLIGLRGQAPIRLGVDLGTPAASGLEGPDRVDGRARSATPIRIPVTGEDLPDPEELQVQVPEGQVVEVLAAAEGLEVLWQPLPDREARAVAIGLRDQRRPGAPPIWVTARLRAKVPVSVTTEPGTRLTVQVSGRTYGPVVADSDGRAATTVDLWPGETRAEATLEDDLGNSQRTPIVLPGSSEPSLSVLVAGVLAPGSPPPPLHLRAIDARGRSWSGGQPECRATGVGELPVSAVSSGTWRATLPPRLVDLVQDLRVDCGLPGTSASTTMRIPVGGGVPRRVVLRVYPEVLTSDFPVAQVQAHVEDLTGDRVSPDRLSLLAEHGQLTPTADGRPLVAADFTASPDHRQDVIRALWYHPPGTGSAWDLKIARGPDGRLIVRAIDRLGRPIPEVSVALRVNTETHEALTDARGWAVFTGIATGGQRTVEARTTDVVRRVLETTWAPLPIRDPAGPDLVAEQPIAVEVGRVREVYISADPSLLYTGSGDTAQVTVRLLDREGSPVVDEEVVVQADRGVVSALEVLPDGSLEATYSPPTGLSRGPVELVAQGPGGAFAAATSLTLQPRPMDRSLSAVSGVLAGPGPRVSPFVGVDFETRFPFVARGLLIRASAAGWVARTTVEDSDREADVELHMELVSLSVAVFGRWERDLWTLWAGGGAQVVPYHVEIRYAEVAPVAGFGLHQPGLVAFVGGGRRFRAGEVFAELRGLGVSAYTEDFGYEGQLGGVALLAGYRLIF